MTLTIKKPNKQRPDKQGNCLNLNNRLKMVIPFIKSKQISSAKSFFFNSKISS